MTVLTAADLRAFINGTWILESYQSYSIDGSDARHPMGSDVKGTILYTADGYMSAQIMRPDRPRFQADDLGTANKDELAAAGSGYVAYSGPYTVSDGGMIAHHVAISLMPNWIGGTQHRAVQIADSRLQLTPTEPVLLNGQRRNVRLVWRRP